MTRLLSNVAIVSLLLVSVSGTFKFARAEPTSNIQSSLLHKMEKGENSPVSVILTMTGPTTRQVLEAQGFEKKAFPTRASRLNSVTRFLKERAQQSQRDVLAFLRKESEKTRIKFSQLWISNQIKVTGADLSLSLLRELEQRSDILRIEEDEPIFEVLPVAVDSDWLWDSDSDPNLDFDVDTETEIEVEDGEIISKRAESGELEWGIQMMEVEGVWASGNRGEGIVVSTIDSGVRISHESLSKNYRGSYGWFDAINGHSEPYDDRSHGTHVVGSIAGSHGIGVAPGSLYIACKALNENGSSAGSSIKECAQWILCPTDPQGENEDCSKAPHIVNNSWGGSSEGTHDPVISAWRAAGIIPVFSNGNNGRLGCATSSHPGNSSQVLGVGATNINDTIADFSSRGPTDDGRIKPDISAPGALILSASNNTDDGYVIKSGTSMASPHVAGLVALLLNEFGELTFDQVRDVLIEGTVWLEPAVENPNEVCGGISQNKYPNNHIGFGRVNATRSVLETIPKWSFDCLEEGYFPYDSNPRFYFNCQKDKNGLNLYNRRDYKCSRNQIFNGQACV